MSNNIIGSLKLNMNSNAYKSVIVASTAYVIGKGFDSLINDKTCTQGYFSLIKGLTKQSNCSEGEIATRHHSPGIMDLIGSTKSETFNSNWRDLILLIPLLESERERNLYLQCYFYFIITTYTLCSRRK